MNRCKSRWFTFALSTRSCEDVNRCRCRFARRWRGRYSFDESSEVVVAWLLSGEAVVVVPRATPSLEDMKIFQKKMRPEIWWYEELWYNSYEAISETDTKAQKYSSSFILSLSFLSLIYLKFGDMKSCGIIHMKQFQRLRREIRRVLDSMVWGREEKEEEEEEWNAQDAANSVNAALCMSSL